MIHSVYRCWIIWGGIVRVIIIPTILAFAFLGSIFSSVTPFQFVYSSCVASVQLLSFHFLRLNIYFNS